MHLEILVEDASGKALIDCLMPEILDPAAHSWRVISYKGIGRIPKGLKPVSDPAKRVLLDQLPRLFKGYANSLHSGSAVVVVVDLDDRDCEEFKKELMDAAVRCAPTLRTLIRIAIEEIEAWILGDQEALLRAFPKADRHVLREYRQDSICGTWERLADALRSTDAGSLKKGWAARIGPHMAVDKNLSPSFRVFRNGIRSLAES